MPNWDERMAKAVKEGAFTDADVADAQRRAARAQADFVKWTNIEWAVKRNDFSGVQTILRGEQNNAREEASSRR
jgi:hypothetical protein